MAEITIADATPRVQYTVGGTPTTGPWTIPWPYWETADIKVYFDGVLQTITTDYTISGTAVDDGFSSGAVTAVSSQSSITVTVERDVAIARTTDFPTGPFSIATLNKTLDKLFAIGQWLETKIGRAATRPFTSTETYSLDWPDGATSTGKALLTSTSGLTLGPMADEISNAQTYATNASASASAASTSETNAATSETNAGNSATAAAAAAGSNLFNAVAAKATADSPYTVVADTDDGTMFIVTMDGNVTMTLPSIATALEGERYGILRSGASNVLTLARNGTDTINGVAGNYTVEALDGTVMLLIADEASPDNWLVIPWTQAQAGTGLSQTGSTISLDRSAGGAWTGPQRATPIADNDGSFDLAAKNNFEWTPAAADVIEFTNEATTGGQTGVIKLFNPSAYAITKGAEVECDADFLSTVSAAGNYLIGYYVNLDGATVTVTNSQAVAA